MGIYWDEEAEQMLKEIKTNPERAMWLLGYTAGWVLRRSAYYPKEIKRLVDLLNVRGPANTDRLAELYDAVSKLLARLKLTDGLNAQYSASRRLFEDYWENWPLSSHESMFYFGYGQIQGSLTCGKTEIPNTRPSKSEWIWKYEILLSEAEAESLDEIEPGFSIANGEPSIGIIESYETLESALAALEKYPGIVQKLAGGKKYAVREYWIQENAYAPDGRWMSGGKIRAFAKLENSNLTE